MVKVLFNTNKLEGIRWVNKANLNDEIDNLEKENDVKPIRAKRSDIFESITQLEMRRMDLNKSSSEVADYLPISTSLKREHNRV